MTNKGDLISREILLNEFNTKCQRNCPTCEYHKWNSTLNRYECELINTAPTVNFIISPDYVTGLQNINKELIKQLEEAERPQGKWIPVSERLPEFTGLYLISVDDVVTVANFTGTYFMHRGGGRVKVYAWQLLPAPYKTVITDKEE